MAKKAAPPDPKIVRQIIEKELYEGIRDQDGWETLELTVRDAYSNPWADAILEALKKKD